MKKIIFISALFSLFGTTSAMKQVNHPCLPLEFYKHAFGWIVHNAQLNPELNAALFNFMNERKVIINQLLKDNKPFSEGKMYRFPGEHAFKLAEKLAKEGMKDKDFSLWHYECASSDMLRYAIRKNLGIETPQDQWFKNRLFAHETWPMKAASEQEVHRQFQLYYSKSKILDLAILVEEKTAHTVMKHFLQNPEVIHGKHLINNKN